MIDDLIITQSEMADILNVHTITVGRWFKNGSLNIKKIGRYYSRFEFNEFVKIYKMTTTQRNDYFQTRQQNTNESILFAEFIWHQHYRLYSVENGIYFWKREAEIKTTSQLFNEFSKR